MGLPESMTIIRALDLGSLRSINDTDTSTPYSV